MATGDERVRVDVLGPIRAVDGAGRDVTPDGTLQRRLLALLVLHRGRVVSPDAAVEALWPAAPPRDPPAALQNHVFRLRRRLPEGLIDSVADGYRLDPSRVDLDADRLVAALGVGATADEAALADVDELLDRWQGPAYPELADVDDGRLEAGRLHELRIRARELRAERRLVRGGTGDLVAELYALADDEPLRERPRSLLMTALAGAGRQVEALRVYDDFRRSLADELGIEPSPVLAAQHAALLAGTAPAPWRPAHRLPVPATSLVGREPLATEVTALVEAHRAVTLVGPGGVGKTRLLVEVGHRLREASADRPVVMCELATAGPETTADVVAATLGVDARPGIALGERIAHAIADSDVVLLLDNCEHVLEAAAALTERLLGHCPRVRIVASSRERLRVAGEHVRSVPTLPCADPGAPAVQLFVERARAVAPGFDPHGAELACVEQIVQALDGLPLAIELAAARLHTHDVSEVAAGLDRRFALLTSGSRTTSRHGSLSAAVSWSFELLDADLRRTFTDVAVFAGSFAAADAAAVCGTDEATAATELAELAERSLVMRTPDRRYVLLETLRAFGAEQLVASGRDDFVRERHARHQVEWIERTDRCLAESDRPVLAEIDAAVPELRTALEWLVDHEQPELAGRMLDALIYYGFLRLRPDVLGWAERVLAADPDDRSPLAAQVATAAAYAAWMAGDVTDAGRLSARALAAAERAGDAVPSKVAVACGNYELFEGRLDAAIGWYDRALGSAGDDAIQRLFVTSTTVLARAYAGDPVVREHAARLIDDVGDGPTALAAYAWFCAGEADLTFDLDRARGRLAVAAAMARDTNAALIAGLARASIASIDARVGDPDAAAVAFRELLVEWRRAGMWSTQWTMLRAIAGLLARLGRHHAAAVLEGAVRATAAGHRIFGADELALRELGEQLATTMGAEAYDAALREGSVLDGDAAVEHALRSL